MKKAAVFFMLVALFSMAMFNCPPPKVTIQVMAYGNEANQEGQNWVRIVENFQKENPNVTFDYELLYDEAYHQKVTANLAGGEKSTPDLAYFGPDARWGKPWQEAGQFFDHRPYMDASYYDLKLIPPMGPNGEIYEIPLGTSNICTTLFMNEELVKELGFSAPKTYADLVAMVPKATAAGIEVVSIDGADGWAWGSCLMSTIIARVSGDANFVSKTVAGKYQFTGTEWVAALTMLQTMVKDGVISSKSVGVDYGTNLANFGNKKALFCVQGQWAAGSIEKAVQDVTILLAWPALPGEKAAMAGTVAAAPSVGYGLTKKGGSNAAVRDAALKFLTKYFYSEPEVTQRLRDGAIVAPILKNYQVPSDIPIIVKRKVELAQKAGVTEVIDSYLTGAPNDALNAGMQEIVKGTKTPEQVAAEVQALLK
ncbi:MAG: extracellular solute-binding protein [Deltaproteobacteria bacterium]|nr:extracellular solute-binding protein [Deltaproteobacteria bacterium]